MTVRTRIAPSPTGIAHLGTAYQAQRDYAFAKKRGGQFVVRIEDTDQNRYVEGAVDVVFEAFKWLGYQYDEGPDIGGPHAPYVQSQRLPIYQDHAKQLVESGQAYYCFCTKERLDKVRSDQQAKRELPRYDRHCRALDPAEAKRRAASGEPFVIRLKVPDQGETIVKDTLRGEVVFQNTGIDDQVILKSDGYPTYHLAVVVDDHLMGITHIIRGEEWLSSAPKHVLLFQAFGWELPSMTHLPIIRNKDHSKMSKRKNDVSILSYRDKGYLPEALNNYLALMGWSHPAKKEVFGMDEFIDLFTLERITLTAPVFDLDKLNWLNGHYIRQLSNQELFQRLLAPTGAEGKGGFIPQDCPADLVPKLVPLVKERLVTLADFELLTTFFYRKIEVDKDLLHKKSNPEQVKIQLESSVKTIEQLADSDYTPAKLEESFRALASGNNWQPGQFFMMLRIAVTGEKATPPLFDTMAVLGRDQVLTRLKRLIA